MIENGINVLETNGPWLFPLVLSVVFILANLIVKGVLKILNPGIIGGDLAFSGCTILPSGLLKAILSTHVDAAITITVFLVLMLEAILWITCLAFSRSQRNSLRAFLAFLGGVILFASLYACWYITK